VSQYNVGEIDGQERSEPKKLYGFFATPGIDVMNLVFANDDVVWISWKYGAEEHVSSVRHTNEVIGSHFIAGERMHLYLVRLLENAMYSDTDTISRGTKPS